MFQIIISIILKYKSAIKMKTCKLRNNKLYLKMLLKMLFSLFSVNIRKLNKNLLH